MSHEPTKFAAATALHGQSGQPQTAMAPFTAMAPSEVANCIKIEPGKARECRQFVVDVTSKWAQARVSDGRSVQWSLLRAVAEEMVKEGTQSTWSFHVRVLPAGTGMPFSFVTVDAYPSQTRRSRRPQFENSSPRSTRTRTTRKRRTPGVSGGSASCSSCSSSMKFSPASKTPIDIEPGETK